MPGELASGTQAVVRALRRWKTPRTTSSAITPAATKATVAAMPAMRPIVDQAKVDSSSPRSVSPLKRVLRWSVIVVGLGLQLGDVAACSPGVLGGLDGRLGGALRGPEVGVGRAVGDAVEMVVDEAGVGLGLGAGRHLLAGVPDQVVAALLLEAGRSGK